MSHPPLAQQMARRILQRMGEAGQPPEQGIRFVNVGNETYLQVLDKEYLELLLGEVGGSSFKLVQGYFGAGKTHFLYCLRDMAWQRNYLTALVGLSSTECPFDRRLLVYQRIASRLTLPPLRDGEEPVVGLPAVLQTIAEERIAEMGEEAFHRWVGQSYARASVEWHPYRRAIARYLQSQTTAGQPIEALEAWLLGEPVSAGDVRPFGVFESPTEQNAFGMLRSLLQSVVHLGQRGTILMFDEMDRTLSLGRRRTRELGDNLRQLIDLCSLSELPSTLFLYAVPPEFLSQVVPEYPALQQRLQSPVPLSYHSPKSPLIDLERLDLEPEPLLVELGERLLLVEQAAHQTSPTEVDRENLRRLASAVVDNLLDISHRRLFVKAFIALLDARRAQAQAGKPLSELEAVNAVQRTYEALSAAQQDATEFCDD